MFLKTDNLIFQMAKELNRHFIKQEIQNYGLPRVGELQWRRGTKGDAGVLIYSIPSTWVMTT